MERGSVVGFSEYLGLDFSTKIREYARDVLVGLEARANAVVLIKRRLRVAVLTSFTFDLKNATASSVIGYQRIKI